MRETKYAERLNPGDIVFYRGCADIVEFVSNTSNGTCLRLSKAGRITVNSFSKFVVTDLDTAERFGKLL